MLFTSLLLSACAMLANAQEPSPGGFAVSFFAQDNSTECQERSNSSALIVTGLVMPEAPRLCFTLDDLFNTPRDTANQDLFDYDERIEDPSSPLTYLLDVYNSGNYDSGADYTSVVIQHVKSLTDTEPGSPGTVKLSFSRSTSCRETDDPDFQPVVNDCQTTELGECNEAPWAIQSIAIEVTPIGDVDEGGSCEDFVLQEAKASIRAVSGWMLLLGLAGALLAA